MVIQPNSSPEQRSKPRKCVVCYRSSPKSIFSCRYKVHDKNMAVLENHFERTLCHGELCDRCYRTWYKHRKQKKKTNQNKEISSEEEVTDSITSSKRKKRNRNSNRINSNIHSEEGSLSGSTSSDVDDEEFFAKNENYLASVKAITKPPRKSRRKATPIRSVRQQDPVTEWLSSSSSSSFQSILDSTVLNSSVSDSNNESSSSMDGFATNTPPLKEGKDNDTPFEHTSVAC
eukprot:gb/GECH01009626.1/.p1 GENE.gb/GECH01009626.1/~~gb/GECH01009626.1/.p1  ORF type:complete len:231 (+),score=56.10 gb/GECH01009626.1/:1-693(+)